MKNRISIRTSKKGQKQFTDIQHNRCSKITKSWKATMDSGRDPREGISERRLTDWKNRYILRLLKAFTNGVWVCLHSQTGSYTATPTHPPSHVVYCTAGNFCREKSYSRSTHKTCRTYPGNLHTTTCKLVYMYHNLYFFRDQKILAYENVKTICKILVHKYVSMF